jgi:peptide/nickel transport system substrate-binding protein
MDLSIGKSRWLRVSTLVAGLAVLLSACGGSSSTGQSITNGGTLIWALDADAQSLNPFVAGDVPSVRAYGFIFPNLYQADKDLNITPDLADGMPSISADGKVWTVKLRKNAKWSDGSPITADDVVMTVNLQNNDKLDTDAAFDWGELDKVEKVDANTVKFTLKDVFAPFLANQLLTFVAPASVYGKIDPAKQRTDPVSLNPTVTGGPYKFDKRVAGSEIDYVANTNYYLGRPHYDKVIAKVITDATAATNALINGDVAWHPALGEGGSGSVTKAKAASGVQVHDYADLGYIDMRLNTRKGHLFDNVLTRQAMATALDKPSIVQAATEGRGQVLWGDLVPAYWAYDANSVVTYTQDVAKAKSLLTQAGWTIPSDGGPATRPNPNGGAPQKFVGKIRVRAGKAQRIKAATIISDQLKAIGIQLTPDPTDFKVFYKPIQQGNFDVAIAGFGLTVDPDNFQTFHSSQLQPEHKSGNNWTGYNNPELDKLIDQERTTIKSTAEATKAARKAIFNQIEKIISGDVVTYMLWADKSAMGWSSNVGGVVAGGGDNVIYVDDARNTQVEAAWYSKTGK